MHDDMQVASWLERAHKDLIVAKHLFHEMHPKQLEVCCYECQQTVEKALKAYLISCDYEFPRTHDLGRLCSICATFKNDFSNYIDDCTDLSPYSVEARYPSEAIITEAVALSSLRKAERIFSFCFQLIKNG